jgi:hypothetical protein
LQHHPQQLSFSLSPPSSITKYKLHKTPTHIEKSSLLLQPSVAYLRSHSDISNTDNKNMAPSVSRSEQWLVIGIDLGTTAFTIAAQRAQRKTDSEGIMDSSPDSNIVTVNKYPNQIERGKYYFTSP